MDNKIDLSNYVPETQIRESIKRLGWNEQQYLEWAYETDPSMSDELRDQLIERLFRCPEAVAFYKTK